MGSTLYFRIDYCVYSRESCLAVRSWVYTQSQFEKQRR